jgi:GT2 family glycosyltransferase
MTVENGDREVSVITPCYNAASFLRETIDSVLSQTRPAREVIVVDDGSTDDSATIAESYGPPVRVLRQKNQGESVARNAGIAAASGKYVLFLDADDLLDPAAIDVLFSHARRADDGVACMGHSCFREDPSTPFLTTMPPADRFFPGIIQANFGPPHCWLTPRELIVRAGSFLTTLQYSEDWDLWWRVGMAGGKLIPVEYVGALYRRHPASQVATAGDSNRALGHARLMDRMCREFLQRPEMLREFGETLFWSAWTALHRCRRLGRSWNDLHDLAQSLQELASRGPRPVTRTMFARAIRWLGIKRAESLRTMYCRAYGNS